MLGLASQLRDEGAQAFDESWNRMMKEIESKSALLEKTV
mgnify:CR=1 FL=1